MNNYIDLPVEGGGGGGGGVTSLNTITGAVTLLGSSGITITPAGQNIIISSTAAGTVTSVGLADSTGIFNVTGSPVTTAGTLTLSSLKSQAQAAVFIGPVSGGPGAPSFRALAVSDVPTLNQNTTGTAANITAASNSTLTTLSALSLPVGQLTGTLPFSNGGTNATTLTGARTSLGIDTGDTFITSGTTYTTPSSITASTLFKFRLIGGGGGGSSANVTADHSTTGGGGGGGTLFISGLSPNTAYSITIGSGGSGGAAGAVGTAGGSTTLTIGPTTYTAAGGSAAATVTGNGGAGGASTNSTINITGRTGGGSYGVATSSGGTGGDSPWGFGLGAPGLGQSVAGSGNPATGFGGGGGGASGSGSPTGGAGSQGCILVEYFN